MTRAAARRQTSVLLGACGWRCVSGNLSVSIRNPAAAAAISRLITAVTLRSSRARGCIFVAEAQINQAILSVTLVFVFNTLTAGWIPVELVSSIISCLLSVRVDLTLVQSPRGHPRPPGDLTSALQPLKAVDMCWSSRPEMPAGSGER